MQYGECSEQCELVPLPLVRIACIALVFLTCACVLAAAAPAHAATPTRAERTMLARINDAREARGIRRLYFGDRIQTRAHNWAVYLLRNDAFYHGSIASGVSENIAWITCRDGWARAVVRMWLNSYTHRVNMLDRSARRAGVGVATGRWRGYSCVRIVVARFA